ncbi:MAG: hypothetical protein HQM15_04725 [Deltaproteobacteria bacterium]|nr:hypothetical protein [Deltaproteobacteria bacterium]
MNNEEDICKIELSLNAPRQSLNLRILWPNKMEEQQEFLIKNGEVDLNSLYLWILSHCKKIFEWEEIPHDIQFTIDHQFNKIPEILQVCQKIMNVLAATLNKIKENRFLKEEFRTFEGKLFYNIDDHAPLKDLYEKIKEKHPDQAFYLNAKSGWNKLKRCWETSEHYSSEQLIHLIREKRIKTLYSVNCHYLENILSKEKLLLCPLLKHLGLEFTTLDYDTYELLPDGFWTKALFNTPGFRRFSTMPNISKFFDQHLNHKELRYFSFSSIQNPKELIQNPQEDCEILFTAHARAPDLLSKLPQVLHYLHFVDSEKPFEDYQLLYYAICHLLLHSHKLNLEEKIKHFYFFSHLYLNTLSLLKYEVISGIQSKKVSLHGDAAWKHLFPEYYCEKYLNKEEIKEKLEGGKALYLLMNQNYSYFENNPVFLQAINCAGPYLCFPAVTVTPELEGLRLPEYKNINELNQKLNHLSDIFGSVEYQTSLLRLKTYIHSCSENFYEQIDSKKPILNLYQSFCDEHEKLYLNSVDIYLKKNFYKVTQCMDELMNKKREEFQIHQYSYFHKPYIQNLLSNFGRNAS